MGRLVNCAYCNLKVDKDVAVRHKDKNYHSDCAQLQIEKEELMDYICFLFGLKAPGPVVYSQLKNFLAKGYTYQGILYSLKYFYDIKKNSLKKSNQAIGIVPYVYDEAQEYYKNMAEKQNQLKEVIAEQMQKAPVMIKIKKQPKKEKLMYNLEEL